MNSTTTSMLPTAAWYRLAFLIDIRTGRSPSFPPEWNGLNPNAFAAATPPIATSAPTSKSAMPLFNETFRPEPGGGGVTGFALDVAVVVIAPFFVLLVAPPDSGKVGLVILVAQLSAAVNGEALGGETASAVTFSSADRTESKATALTASTAARIILVLRFTVFPKTVSSNTLDPATPDACLTASYPQTSL